MNQKNRLHIAAILSLMVLSLMFNSCTNPNLKNSADESAKASEPSAYEPLDKKSESEETDDGRIYLDRLSGRPSMTLDEADEHDISVAVDDYIWRQLNLAQEYFLMGVLANSETIWDEAQYYFEKSLGILGDIDIDTESEPISPEGAKYNQIFSEIIANYKITLVSLGHLPSDVSADALISRFSEINHIVVDSVELRRLEKYAQEKVAYNVPIIMNERVKKAILYYQTVAHDAFARYLSRSTKYIPMIDRILTEHGIPTDIKYLALVESGYNPKAYSWARAMGLWQFIASTGRMYDMHRNWWYDERKDPVKSTHAAARFLKDLYNKFGSWELAMAAYNGGPGRVSRTIKKQKTKDFWKLDLHKQTEDYVPFFMAATIICKNPEKFGFTDINYQPEWTYDEVVVKKCLDLNVVAKAIGSSVKELKAHNPELLRQFTPPKIKEYTLRIPKGSQQKFLAAYENMPSSKQTSWVQHKIRKGESVSTIARKYGVSQYAIFSANNLSRRSKIYAGKLLVVPVPNGKSYSSSKKSNYEMEGNLYSVRSGDNVWEIANAFGTTPEKIRRLNKLDHKSRIYVGQKLVITDNKFQKSYASTNASVDKSGNYKVKRGDSLWEIAKKFNTSVSDLRRLNGLGRRSYIYPGQKLKVPGLVSRGNDYQIYTIRRGDTVSEIAARFNTTVSNIKSWNSIRNLKKIRPGDKLKIYTRN